jgi:hypothetical protein
MGFNQLSMGIERHIFCEWLVLSPNQEVIIDDSGM